MRDAINNNPIAQMAVVAVLLVLTAFLLMSGPLKKEEAAPPAGSPEAGAVPPVAGAAPPVAGAIPSDPGAIASATGAVGAAPPVVPGPPLPRAVAAAQAEGKVLALLMVRAGGHDDRLLRGAVKRLRGVPGLALFTTRAEGIARYARITQGAEVYRVPALVVVRPPQVPGGVATAEVRYGFRDAQSVVQAVRDLLYRGPTVGYSPE
jgi:hypothetical protein